MTIGGAYSISIHSNGVYAVVFYWALAGAILSFLSRYGGILTLVGFVPFFAGPYVSYSSVSPALGVLIAFAGAVLTLTGVRWSIPRGIMRAREVLGGILYSIGFLIMLSLLVTSFLYGSAFSMDLVFEAAPLLIVAILMTGLGLKLFLTDEKRTAVLLHESRA